MSRNTKNSSRNFTAAFEEFCDRCSERLSNPAGTLIVTFCIIGAGLLANPPADPDLFARVAMGRLIAAYGIFCSDPFGFTLRKPVFIDHEWFAGYLFYYLTRVGGEAAIVFFSLGTLLLAMWFLYKAGRTYAPSGRVYFPCFLLGVGQCSYIWASFVRSQVFTYFFLAVLLWAIAVFERKGNPRPLWLGPPMMLIWANAHGGFVTGLGLMGLFATVLLARRDFPRALYVAAILLLMLAATFLNPYGITKFWSFILYAVTMPRPAISEWQSLSPSDWASWVSYLYFALVFFGMWALAKKVDFLASLFLVIALWQGFTHVRLIAIASMVSVAFCQDSFRAAVLRLAGARKTLIRVASFAVLALAIGSAVLLGCRMVSLHFPFLNYTGYPNQAVTWLRRSNLAGNVLVDFNNGSYALWRLFPRFRVALDGRYEEVYPEETVRKVSEALDPENPRFLQSFNEVAPDFALFPNNQTVKKALELLPGEWRVFASAGRYAVLGRGVPPSGLSMPDEGVPPDMWDPLY